MKKILNKIGSIIVSVIKSIGHFFKKNALILILWLLLIVIFVVGGIYFEHVKIDTAGAISFIGILLGGGA